MNIFIARQILLEAAKNNLNEVDLSAFGDEHQLSTSDLAELIPLMANISDLRKLSLSNNRLTAIPDELCKLINIQELYLARNLIENLPGQFTELKNLRVLNLSANLLTTIPEEICELVNLEKLTIKGSAVKNIPENICRLTRLRELNLSNNFLESLPQEISQLSSLQILDLAGNYLTDLPKDFEKLINLEVLILTYNRLTSFIQKLTDLSNLTQLNLNGLSETTIIFGSLHNEYYEYLKKYRPPSLLQGNGISSIPTEIRNLKNLTELALRANQLEDLPISVTNLEKLQYLDLRENPLPFPVEIIESTSQAQKILNFISDYYRAKQFGNLKPLNEAKLVVVGEANVGKTCIINRLLHNEFIKTDSTHGIEIHCWKYVSLKDGSLVQLNVWDFGGQEIMHSTHQFFFTKRTVYILVINARENQENNKTEEWLQRIKNLSADSPVFIVGNKIDENNRGTDRTSIGYFDIDRTNLNKKFPNLIKGFYGVSSDTEQSQFDFLFEDFKKALISEIGNLPEIHKEFPANWFEIKSQLEQMQANKIPYITFHDYISRCLKADIENEESQRTLIEFMHDLGIALSFQNDKELRDLAVLNPEWVTRGVYALIDNAQITLEKGILKREDISRYLNEEEYPAGETQDFIVKMMRKFKLLVDIEKDKVFLLPDLLPKDEPDTGDWINALHFQYGYEIYEKSILRSFIVEMYPIRSKETYWRNGIVLLKGTNRALVKADVLRKFITIKIEGNPSTRREFLAIIRREFDKIHGRFDSFDVIEKVGHPKYPDILRDYQRLLKMEENRVELEFVEELEISLPVKDWLDGVESAERRIKNRQKKKFEETKIYKLTSEMESETDDKISFVNENRKTEIDKWEKELDEINNIKAMLDKQAKELGKLKIRPRLAGFGLLIFIVLGISFYFGFTFIGVIISVILFFIPSIISHITGKDWTFTKATEQQIEKERNKLYLDWGIFEQEKEINKNLKSAKDSSR